MADESAPLPDYVTEALGEDLGLRQLARGEAVFRNGDPVGEIFFVRRGALKAVRYLPDGAEVVMMRAGPGEFFAESALAATRYSCDGFAVKPGAVAILPVAAVNRALERPDFARAFIMAIAGHSRRQCSRYERLRLRSAADRVLHMILCEAGPDGVLDWQGPLSELAVELSLEPETLYRILAELERAGRIRREKRRIEIVS
ncbi:MAG: Crp/Fnr family transcriptional regulator [Alphaproteobacteria bacterium]|nr:MAG: Crp/Fnr family transcriptional regulator [Alphaproteobacteria bacterium]